MRLPLTLAVTLVTALMAGCLGGPGETMTARDGLDDARATAESWADGEDLELLGVVAIEPFKHIRYSEDDDGEDDEGDDERDEDEEDERDEDGDDEGHYEAEFVTHLDGNPGDGKAPGWAYGFYTGERCVTVVLAAGIGVLAEGYETCDDDLDTLPEWSVDSDEVAEILKEHDEWADLGEDGTYFWGLFNDDGTAIWAVGGTGEDGESVFATVDADSGEVLEIVHEIDGDIEAFFEAESQGETRVDMGGSDEDSDSEVYMVLGDELVTEVDLGAMGRIDVQVSANVVVNSLTLTVEGPYGVVAEDDLGGLLTGVSQQGRTYEDLPAGHYTVTLVSGGSAVLPALRTYSEW